MKFTRRIGEISRKFFLNHVACNTYPANRERVMRKYLLLSGLLFASCGAFEKKEDKKNEDKTTTEVPQLDLTLHSNEFLEHGKVVELDAILKYDMKKGFYYVEASNPYNNSLDCDGEFNLFYTDNDAIKQKGLKLDDVIVIPNIARMHNYDAVDYNIDGYELSKDHNSVGKIFCTSLRDALPKSYCKRTVHPSVYEEGGLCNEDKPLTHVLALSVTEVNDLHISIGACSCVAE